MQFEKFIPSLIDCPDFHSKNAQTPKYKLWNQLWTHGLTRIESEWGFSRFLKIVWFKDWYMLAANWTWYLCFALYVALFLKCQWWPGQPMTPGYIGSLALATDYLFTFFSQKLTLKKIFDLKTWKQHVQDLLFIQQWPLSHRQSRWDKSAA